jgi:hypothetical protein
MRSISVQDSDPKQSLYSDRPKSPPAWRWLLVVPALVVGYVIPGLIVRISWESGSTWVPFFGDIVYGWAQILQSVVDGIGAVYLAVAVAPSRKKVTSLLAGIVVVAAGGFGLWMILVSDTYGGGETWPVVRDSALVLIVTASGAGTAYVLANQER